MKTTTVSGSFTVRIADSVVVVDLTEHALIVRDPERLLQNPQHRYKVLNALSVGMQTLDEQMTQLSRSMRATPPGA